MKNMLKKYWFILTVMSILVVFLSLFVYASVKDKLPGKKQDGKDVVVIFNNQAIFADDVFENSKKVYGSQVMTSLIVRELFAQAIPTTDEMTKEVTENKNKIIENYKKKNPQNYEEEISKALQQIGYSNGIADLDAYLQVQLKTQKALEDYVLAHKDQYFNEIEEKKGRIVSHILVKFPTLTQAEKEGKTAEEIERLQAEKIEATKADVEAKKATIDKELETKSFKEVAAQYSDDEASKVNNGSLGFVNSETSFVKEFLDASLALEDEKVSDWVKTEYGYHKIRVDAKGVEKLLANKDVKVQLLNAIIQKDKNIYKETIKEIINKYPVVSEDETVKKIIKSITE